MPEITLTLKSAKHGIMHLNSDDPKAQSAIEYLMTYGWMLLVVAIVGGAIFSAVGEQSIERVQGFDGGDINVRDFGVSYENGLMFSMNDPIGQTEVKEIKVDNPDTTNISYVLDQRLSTKDVINLPGIKPADDSNELEMEIIYNTDSLENLSATGTVAGNLEIDENLHNHTMILGGLVGYWPLNEEYSNEDKVYDLTTNNNHGTKENDPEFVEGIGSEEALEFDGDEDYVESEGISAIDKDGEYTFVAWFRPEAGSGRGRAIFQNSKEDENRNGMNVRDGTVRFGYYDGNWVSHSGEIDHSEWTHVSGVNAAGELSLYIDGEPVSDTGEAVYVHHTEGLYLGQNTNDEEKYEGRIGDVRIYNRALSEDEIETLYESRN